LAPESANINHLAEHFILHNNGQMFIIKYILLPKSMGLLPMIY